MSTSACRRRFSAGCVLTPMALRCRDARLNDASTRDAILSEVHALLAEDTRFAKMYQQQWGNDRAWNSFYPIIDDWDYEPEPSESISSIAKASGRSRLEVAYDHMCTRGATGTIWRGA